MTTKDQVAAMYADLLGEDHVTLPPKAKLPVRRKCERVSRVTVLDKLKEDGLCVADFVGTRDRRPAQRAGPFRF